MHLKTPNCPIFMLVQDVVLMYVSCIHSMEAKVYHFSDEGKNILAVLPWNFEHSTAYILNNGTLIWIVGGTKFTYVTKNYVIAGHRQRQLSIDYLPEKETTMINLR